MDPYRLLSKTIKPNCMVHSQIILDEEAAKKHPDYPKLEWDQHNSRFHVTINQSIDQTYVVSAIDDDYKEATTREIIVTEEDTMVVSGVDTMHMDPDNPAEFRNRLSDLVCSITDDTRPNYNGIFVDNVMMYLRYLDLNTEVDDDNYHWFITLELGIEEIYGCFEDVDDNW